LIDQDQKQNALWLAAQVLLNQRRTAVMENPGYPGLRVALNLARCNVVNVPVDHAGMRLDALPDETDVVFTTPSHHCPTSVTMPLERRQELLEMASRKDFLIVEDDYEFEMSFLNPPAPALKSLDEEGRVIYVGSFSKSLFPGLRLGYMVGSETFIREARALRMVVVRHPPGHLQRMSAGSMPATATGFFIASRRNGSPSSWLIIASISVVLPAFIWSLMAWFSASVSSSMVRA
jgi:GntR family transcriptional regulator/MocR family aminotransferase